MLYKIILFASFHTLETRSSSLAMRQFALLKKFTFVNEICPGNTIGHMSPW